MNPVPLITCHALYSTSPFPMIFYGNVSCRMRTFKHRVGSHSEQV